MCDTIQELDKKNDKAHNEMKKSILKQSEQVAEIKKDMATKADINELKPKVVSANTLSSGYKVLISVLLGLLLMVGGFSTYFIIRSEKSDSARATEQIKMNNILNAINDNIRESNAVAKNFNAKAIMDSITTHWNREAKFYRGEYLIHKKWVHNLADKTVYPTEIRSKRNEVVLKDHEKRIGRLEEITGIKKKSQ